MYQRIGSALVAVLGFAGLLHAEQASVPLNTLTEAEVKDGWKLLFDGKTLNGWMSWKTRKPLESGKWTVQDGLLHLGEKGGGDIYTAELFENFVLSLEWKTEGNSGVFIRVDPTYKGAMHHLAPEMQVHKDNAGELYELYPVKKPLLKRGDWNHVRIRMVGGHGTHWFNGEQVYDYQIGSDDWKERVNKSSFKKNMDRFGMTAKGHIGLQDWVPPVWYRNSKIRPLPAGAAASEAKPATAFTRP